MTSVESISYRSLPFIVENTDHKDWKDFIELFPRYKEHLEQQLLQSGALLFRGFGLQSAPDFKSFVDAFFDSSQSIDPTGAPSIRHQVSEGVYTSTEYPSFIPIHCHNEMSYFKHMPHYICFFCDTAPKKGGETPIADSRGILRSLDPKLRRRLEEKGVSYKRHLINRLRNKFSFHERFRQTWQMAFKTEDRDTVESQCRAQGLNIHWAPNGDLSLSNTLPAMRKHPETGEDVYCNQAHIYKLVPETIGWTLSLISRMFDITVGRGNRYLDSSYGDGTPLPRSDIRAILHAFRNNTVIFSWQKGDVMVLDNYLVAHGRRPFKGPRKILVAMR